MAALWDEEAVKQLRALWFQEISTAEIGRRMGLSKNAIVGKAGRLDLPARPSPIRRDPSKPALPPGMRQRQQRAGKTTLPPLRLIDAPPRPTPPKPVFLAPPPPLVVFKPRSPSTCCWPIGEPGTRTFRFCDDVSIAGKPYCGEHAKIAYIRRSREDEPVAWRG